MTSLLIITTPVRYSEWTCYEMNSLVVLLEFNEVSQIRRITTH